MKNKIPSLSSTITMELSDYYGTQVFFFAMLVSLNDVINCEVINVKNFREILSYFF